MERDEIQFFDRSAEWDVVTRELPHWSQPGAVTFVTWRLADSLPASALERIDLELASLLMRAGLDPQRSFREQLDRVSPSRRYALQFDLFMIRDHYLDLGFGACYFESSELAGVVIESLRRFDRERYILTDAVVMPNHVHFLCAFSSDTNMLKQCTSWKRFTGRQANQRIGRRGEFWQGDQFDHLVRSAEQFESLRHYIADNLSKAGLPADESRYYQLQM